MRFAQTILGLIVRIQGLCITCTIPLLYSLTVASPFNTRKPAKSWCTLQLMSIELVLQDHHAEDVLCRVVVRLRKGVQNMLEG